VTRGGDGDFSKGTIIAERKTAACALRTNNASR
jgi:hypothetical protein